MAIRIVMFIENEGLDQQGYAQTEWYSDKDLGILEEVRLLMEETMWDGLKGEDLTEVDPDEEEDDE